MNSVLYGVLRSMLDTLMDAFIEFDTEYCTVPRKNDDSCYGADSPDPCSHCQVLVRLSEARTALERLDA